MKNKLAIALAGGALLGSLLVGATAFAQTPPTTGSGMPMRMGMKPGVFGTVSAINGDTLTVSSKGFGGFGPHATSTAAVAATTYTVDATNATVFKNGATSTIASVAVNDTVMVQGTVSGTSVTATTIRDGAIPMGGRGGWPGGKNATSTPHMTLPQGNGEPVVGGTVSAISGSSISITNKSNLSYTIDASSATVTKMGATSTLASVAVGDNVVVQGTVNGSAVVASSVIDQGAPKDPTNDGAPQGGHASIGGFLGGIGGFFKNLFGFF